MVVRLAAQGGQDDRVYDLAIDMTRGPESFLSVLDDALVGRNVSK